MTNVKLPQIPRGNLGNKVYVLSDKAAYALFDESSDLIRENWPLPKKYEIPSNKNITLRSGPFLKLPRGYNGERKIGSGLFGMGVEFRADSFSKSTHIGCGEKILEFLCESVYDENSERKIDEYSPVLTPGSHIFVYNMFKPETINLPPESYDFVEKRNDSFYISDEDKKDLDRQFRLALTNIVRGISDSLKKRGAVLTRGWLSNQFVL